MRWFAALFAILLTSAARAADPCDAPRFGTPVALDASQARALASGDFNGDGTSDVAFSPASTSSGGVIVLLLGAGGTVVRRNMLPVAPFAIAAVAAADLNRDGFDDLAVRAGGGVRLFLGNASGDLRLARAPTGDSAGGSGASQLRVVDWDGDGWLDLVSLATSDDHAPMLLLVWLNDRTGGVDLRWTIPLPHFPQQLAAADFDGDRKGDVAVAGLGTVDVVFGDGAGGIARLWQDGLGGTPNAIQASDLDSDGHLDVVLVGCAGFTCMGPMLNVFWGDGLGSFVHTFVSTPGWFGYLWDVVVADFTRDGQADLAISGVPGLHGLAGTGRGRSFSLPGGAPLARTIGPIAAAHVFGSGAPDLVYSWAGGVSALPNACGSSTVEAVLLVPFVIDARGADETRYSTRLAVAHRGGPSDVEVELRFASAFGGSDATGRIRLSALEQLDLPLRELFRRARIPLREEGDGGTLRLRFTGLARAADAGAFALVTSQRPGEAPTRAYFPALPEAHAFTTAASLGWLRQTASERSNLALSNVSESRSVTLRVTLLPDAASPGAPETLDVTLGPGRFLQLGSVLAARGWSGGFARVERVSGGGSWLAWAVTHDRASGDASLLLADPPGRLAGVRSLVVPALVRTDRFASDLLLSNAGDVPLSLSVGGAPVTLAPREQRVWRDAGVDLLPERGLAPVVIEASEGDLARLFAAALTHPRTSGAGALAPSLSPGERARQEAVVPLPAPGYANLVLENGPEEEARLRIEAFDGAGAAAAIEEIVLPRSGLAHLPSVTSGWLPLRPAWLRITRTGSPAPFLAYAVSMDGEGPGAGSGDGAFVPMEVIR